MDELCRFCLFPYDHSSNDYLISPCACRGSIQYVHISCLKKWRTHALNIDYRNNCQLCRNNYTIPRKWSFETLPAYNRFLGILENGVFNVLLSLYIFLICVTRIKPFFNRYTLIENYQESKFNANITYFYILGFHTCIYLGTFIGLFLHVNNKFIYLRYLFTYNIQPIALLLLNGLLTVVMPLPFGQIYLFLWSKCINNHRSLLMKINFDGEF
jgi:E3 ubiquitin-protein ligase DOA10